MRRWLGAILDNLREVWRVLFGVMLLIIALMLFMSPMGCSPLFKQRFKDGLVSLGDCAVMSSLGCVTQSMGGCPPPLTNWAGNDWSMYGNCLLEKSQMCASSALARCAFRSIVDSVDGPVVGGGTGCREGASYERMLNCVMDGEYETEAEAVQAVAYCQRMECLNLEE